MVNKISDYLVNADRVCDYIPIISTVSNLVDIFQKAILHLVDLFKKPSQKTDLGNSYFTHIKDKSYSTCALRMVPIIGNVALTTLDAERSRALAAVKRNGFALGRTSDACKQDKEVVLAAVKQDSRTLQDASESLKNDKAFILELARNNQCSVSYIGEELLDDKSFVLSLLEQDGLDHLGLLKRIGDSLKNDEEIALAGLAQAQSGFFGELLEWTGDSIKNSEKIALALIEQARKSQLPAYETRRLLQWLGDSLKNNEKIVLALVEYHTLRRCFEEVLEWMGDSLKNNEKIADKVAFFVCDNSVQQHWTYKAIKISRAFTLAVVKQDRYGIALRFADKTLLKDKEIVLAAVKRNVLALQFAHKTLQSDKKFILKIVKLNFNVLKYVCTAFLEDREFMLAAIKKNPCALAFANAALKGDKDVVLMAIKWQGVLMRKKPSWWSKPNTILEYVSDELKKDSEVALAAVTQDWRELANVSDEFQDDRDFVLTAVKQEGHAIFSASERLKRDRDLMLIALLNSDDSFGELHRMARNEFEDGEALISEAKIAYKRLNKDRIQIRPQNITSRLFSRSAHGKF